MLIPHTPTHAHTTTGTCTYTLRACYRLQVLPTHTRAARLLPLHTGYSLHHRLFPVHTRFADVTAYHTAVATPHAIILSPTCHTFSPVTVTAFTLPAVTALDGFTGAFTTTVLHHHAPFPIDSLYTFTRCSLICRCVRLIPLPDLLLVLLLLILI